MKTVACIIARTNSTRLPKKVLLEINGKKVIEHIIERIKSVKGIDDIYIATSTHPDDRILGDIAIKNGVKIHYGSETSVIDRMLEIAEIEEASNVIRITGDNIFTDPEILEITLEHHKEHIAEYSRAEYLSIGTTAEVIGIEALKRCYNSIDPNKSEYLFYYIFEPDKYKTLVVIPEEDCFQMEYSSLTVDTPADFERTEFIFDNIDADLIKYKDIMKLNDRLIIPNFQIDGSLNVKLPDRESMSYGNFREIINKRIDKSKVIKYKLI
ncbi:hypothetical protein IZY60_09620 [Lutibacter sp. B2]|nr:hypothetical protein [Lutibacter sp. B2]